MFVLSIGGYAGATYLEVERQFDAEQKQFAESDKRFALIEQRLEHDEKEAAEVATEQREHDAKISAGLDKAVDALNALAVLVAATGHHDSRR